MNQATRFSISMAADLTRDLDRMVEEKGYPNRSQAVSDLVREAVTLHQADRGGSHEIAGTITLVYDHHRRNVQSRMTSIQHDYGHHIMSVLHVHLDHHNCMEVLAVRGPACEVSALADRLNAVKGLAHCKLTVTTTQRKSSK